MIPDSVPIETTVLKKITPNKKEKKEMERTIEALKEQVSKEIKKTNIPITLELVGSTAKDTYIRTAVDIDLFLVFPVTVPRAVLQEQGLKIGRAILEQQEECFAEHPYVRGMFQGYKTELVPCYKIEHASQKLSAVDRTPLHTRYIKDHLDESQKDEVRLFKQFLKGIGCYGAEAEIEGFSGYLCEIMILKYRTFQQLIEQVQHWCLREILTLEEGTNLEFNTPLVFIDPVDSERNVASALSKEKFDLFIKACQDYQKEPRLTFFFPNKPLPWPLEKITEHIETKEFIGIKLPKPEIISENLYPQIRKSVRSIKELCEQHEFTIQDATFSVDEENVYIVLQPKTKTLTKTVSHTGPPTRLKKNADEFIEKWLDNPRTTKKPYEKNKRLYVEIERDYTDIRQLLEDQVRQLSLGKNIDLAISSEITVLDKNDLLIDNLRMFWTTYLDSRMSWER
ncbi:MAG TPA: CCA tRNA nucleotidyltransferase [Thermoplasmata archaeon]|jgi:tRNA nucleotidyltransferase (CCA-adding enzyme)|nr:MAG TPA: CCA tRNA nucleotidyltransferase [Thermoplasmata archaeon]